MTSLRPNAAHLIHSGSLKPFVSLCMIVKNESANLPRCLQSAKSFVDEIIVVDTGSQDDTVAIASQFGAKVYTFEWCNDFSAARNVSLAQATGEWILVLDADEELIAQSRLTPDQINSSPDILAYRVQWTNANVKESLTPLYPTRLFRNLPELRYISRFHEQIVYQEKPFTHHQAEYLQGFKILHYGNGEDVLARKYQRNISILENIRQEEELSLMLLSCLTGLYQETGQLEQAQGCYTEAFERLLPYLIEGTPPESFYLIPILMHSLASQALEQGDLETARLICQRGLEWCGTYPPLIHLTGDILRTLGFALGAIPYYERCLQLGREGTYYKGEPFDISFTTTFPATMLGCAYIDLNQWQEARLALEQALLFDTHFEVANQYLDIVRQHL